MFKWLFGNQTNHLDAAMGLYSAIYMREIHNNFSTEVAEQSAKAAADAYLNYYHSMKESGL